MYLQFIVANIMIVTDSMHTFWIGDTLPEFRSGKKKRKKKIITTTTIRYRHPTTYCETFETFSAFFNFIFGIPNKMAQQSEVGVQDFVLLDEITLERFMDNLHKRWVLEYFSLRSTLPHPSLHPNVYSILNEILSQHETRNTIFEKERKIFIENCVDTQNLSG